MGINEIALEKLSYDLPYIKNAEIYHFTMSCILAAPERYWLKPSAFHKGHHPEDEYGEWGNLIHVRKVLVVARLLADIPPLEQYEKDILYSGLTIHDTGKYGVDGKETYIQNNHAELVSIIFKKQFEQIHAPLAILIMRVAVTHMGRWGARAPENRLEAMGHYADYLASRNGITVELR